MTPENSQTPAVHLGQDGSTQIGPAAVPVEQVVTEFQKTRDVQAVLGRFPSLTAAEVEEAVRFHRHNPDDALPVWMEPEAASRPAER